MCPFISVTVDCATNYDDGFLPILDLKTRVINNEVEYRFYKKPALGLKMDPGQVAPGT